MVPERSGRARTRASARSPMPRRASRSVWVRMAASAPLGAGGVHHRGEVGVDGQVGLAGGGQGIDLLMAAQRLQGVAEAGLGAAVVDQQRRAAVLHEPVAISEPRAAWGADCS